MSSDEVLATLGEAGGIGAIVLLVLGSVIKLIQNNGCTFKMNSCSGNPIVEVDCEKGAPAQRYGVTKSDTRVEVESTTTPENV